MKVNMFNLIKSYCIHQKNSFILIIFLRFLSSAIAILLPLIYSKFITILINIDVHKLILYFSLMILLQAIALILSYIINKIELTLSKKINWLVKTDIIKKILSMPTPSFSVSDGRIFSLINQDANNVYNVVSTMISTLFTIFTIIGIGVTVAIINWKLLLILMCIFPIIFAINSVYSKIIKKKTVLLLNQSDLFNNDIKNFVTNLKSIKNQNAEDIIYDQLSSEANTGRVLSVSQGSSLNNYRMLISLTNFCGYILLNIFGIIFVVGGTLSFGNFVAYINYSKSLTNSVERIINLRSTIQPYFISLDRIAELQTNYYSSLISENQKQLIDNNITEINIDNISITFGSKKIFHEMSLNAKKGEIIGIYANNGLGKTTLSNMLIGDIIAENGSIVLNSVDSKLLKNKSITQHIQYVGIDKSIYNLSILDNIVINKEHVPDKDKLVNLSKLCNIYDDIKNLKNGFDTILDDSLKLSTGQIQKIKLVRALYINPDVLILDEALTPLDNVSKENIKQYLKSISENKIIIIISHNKQDYDICTNTYKIVNKILVNMK